MIHGAGLALCLASCARGGPVAKSGASSSPSSKSGADAVATDPACSEVPVWSGVPPFDEKAARGSLAAFSKVAGACGALSGSVDLEWGPAGCVRQIRVLGASAHPDQASCLLKAFRSSVVPSFRGAGMRATLNAFGDIESIASVSGHMDPKVIQGTVRTRYAKFRKCYDAGLRRDPTLRGRVSVRFVISDSGAASSASDGGSELPDSQVVECVVRTFEGLQFPAPTGGRVWVVYPVFLEPGR
jgi:hypothetical protein